MHRAILTTLSAGLLFALPAPAAGQDNPFAQFGGEKYYSGGSADVTVTGWIAFDEEIPLTPAPSYTSADGQTWIVYGDETSPAPHVIYTYGDYGYGLSVARDGRIAIAEFDMCEGGVEVTATTVVGEYVCPTVETVDRDTFALQQVSITIRFTAQTR
jgi:hypothetical protein